MARGRRPRTWSRRRSSASCAGPRFLRSEDDLGYLLRVLRNTFFSARRAAGRRPQTTPLPDDLDLIEDRSAPAADSRLQSAELYAAISRLPDDFRDALVAIDVVGLSYREAAKALRVREATITTRLHRARQRVAADLVSDSPASGSPPSGSPPGPSTPPASATRRP